MLYRQGDINFIVNREPKSLAGYFAAEHGPSACALAFSRRTRTTPTTVRSRLGAQPVDAHRPDGTEAPGDQGHRRRPLYLIDRFEDGKSIYDIDFEFIARRRPAPRGHGFRLIDHLTHNVYRGRMAFWAFRSRAPVQLPRDPLLRHQGEYTRPRRAR